MVARLLHVCGVFLGPPDEFMKPSPDNPEGYWENMRFVKINERIMAQFGGWWGKPPSFPAHWEFAPEVDPIFKEAEELIERFRDHNCWGWKDPRNSLTMPFWRRLVPDLKVVICVRNPLEVARSILVRGDPTSASSLLQLWLTYYHQLLSVVPPTHRIVTHYQSYFKDGRAEVQRVSSWLDLKISDETLDRASASVSANLRHHHVPTAELVAADVPDEVLRLYLSLCVEAGPVYQQIREHERVAELEDAAAASSLRPRLMQIERLHLLESETAKHLPGMGPLDVLPTHKSDLLFFKPFIRARKALRAVKLRLSLR